ncbi:Tryptophan--tRNA ligase 2 [Borrelia miyamotoi]|uniref:Tryptophan--tRNA ligase n=1 Tax=Borrelia miyamotoi TaxID=47466 RepID=A0AAP8YUV8_9SPIR|nr:tryptophan--tRNA ligase [Borrelia miyamotoi]AHH05413.1 Tryptophanyl-tRNA synthetase [Borrelia miyamotoi FR64b]ATQ15218.2 tryptophan--tRNA ligase [Borrelia miyamotoi]ATQ16402.2 tryptophan--tRNA ligase [Borrelia miyamotoi]ATQ17547.2 tryptophan--tRNA ligase [Borrelia miyamotoi]ATQ18739.2 tryptophan--tRNA ligase [Borrelia miyamotoi]
MQSKIMLTGDRPTGSLHLGHYVGSIVNRLRYQEEYETYIIIADLHTLTTKSDLKSVNEISVNVREMVLDYLACGINPEKVNIYLQSAIPELLELNLILSMIVMVNRLQRIPSIRDMSTTAGLTEVPYGLLGYPILMSADILMTKANLVPVGRDNEAHIELTRELARKFNYLYGENFFPVPEAIFTDSQVLVGIYGKTKMSKSLGNAIFLSDDEKLLYKKVMSMFTDPKRVRADIPGEVDGNPVFIYHNFFNNDIDELCELKTRYKKGTIGDVEVKKRLFEVLNQFLIPIRERREFFKAKKGYIDEIIFEGTNKTRKIAVEVIKEAKNLMGISKTWYGIRRNVEKGFKK